MSEESDRASADMRKRWQDPEYRQRQSKAIAIGWANSADECSDRAAEAAATIERLTAENEKLWAALAWIENEEPRLVDAAFEKFGLEQSGGKL